jgi:mono/diheme cytochrome c family protein
MNRLLPAAVLITCLSGAAIAAADEPPGDVAKGAALVKEECASCHAIAAVGDSPLAPAPPLRTLKTRYPLEQLYEAFAEGITTGHPDMPEFQFEPQQISDMLAYIESLDE